LSRTPDIAETGATYISFDIDSLDPAFAGRGYAGGHRPYIRAGARDFEGSPGLNFVGGDVVAIALLCDFSTHTAQAPRSCSSRSSA
jgi:arginase family enzyme